MKMSVSLVLMLVTASMSMAQATPICLSTSGTCGQEAECLSPEAILHCANQNSGLVQSKHYLANFQDARKICQALGGDLPSVNCRTCIRRLQTRGGHPFSWLLQTDGLAAGLAWGNDQFTYHQTRVLPFVCEVPTAVHNCPGSKVALVKEDCPASYELALERCHFRGGVLPNPSNLNCVQSLLGSSETSWMLGKANGKAQISDGQFFNTENIRDFACEVPSSMVECAGGTSLTKPVSTILDTYDGAEMRCKEIGGTLPSASNSACIAEILKTQNPNFTWLYGTKQGNVAMSSNGTSTFLADVTLHKRPFVCKLQ